MNEEWRRIPGHPDYEVSDLGRVRSWKTVGPGGPPPRYLTGGVSRGYRTVIVRTDGKRGDGFVHRLVAAAFLGPRPHPKAEVRHLDGDKANNRATNLEYGTHQENALDVAKTTGHHFGSRTHCINGHPYDETNTYWRKREGGGRHCRTCRREWARAHAPERTHRGAWQRAKTHCPKGHPYDETNTIRDARGRRCRECARASRRAWYQRQRHATASSMTDRP